MIQLATGRTAPRIALVLGGGGLKGFAHIGVLRALEQHGIAPALYAGTSIGAMVAAAWVGGMQVAEMERRAIALKRRDLFRLDHMGMLMERMRAPSIYLEEPLRALCEAIVPDQRFDELPFPVLVNTVDIERGTQVVWGLPGLSDVPVTDAVYASCALPGFFPPGRVDGRICIDGGATDNLPVSIAAIGMDAVIAIDVGSFELGYDTSSHKEGFASTFMRSATVMMHNIQQVPLLTWPGPPMLLVRPRVSHIPWFDFSHTPDLIDRGYRAMLEALRHLDIMLAAPGGVFPRYEVQIEVDRSKCTGCGLCVALAPQVMAFDGERKAYPMARVVEWSPADGDFVNHCPTKAITVNKVDRLLPVLEAGSDEPNVQKTA